MNERGMSSIPSEQRAQMWLVQSHHVPAAYPLAHKLMVIEG